MPSKSISAAAKAINDWHNQDGQLSSARGRELIAGIVCMPVLLRDQHHVPLVEVLQCEESSESDTSNLKLSTTTQVVYNLPAANAAGTL